MPVNLDDLKKEMDAAKGSFNGFLSWKPKYGESKNTPIVSRVKLFSWPPDSENGATGKKVYKHYGLGPELKDQVICPKTNGMHHACPVCEEIERLTASSNKFDNSRAQNIGRKERYQLLVGDMDLLEKEGTKFIGIFDAAAGYARRIASLMLGDWGDFTAWESNILNVTGYSQGQGNPKKLEVDGSPKRIKLDPKEWLPLAPKLDELFIPKSYAEIHKILHGEQAGQTTSVADTSTAVEPAQEDIADDDVPFKAHGEVASSKSIPVVEKTHEVFVQKEVVKEVPITKAADPLAPGKKNLAELLAKTRRSK